MSTVERLQPADSDDDLLPVVDARDRPLGVRRRREVHLEGLRHRAVHVAVFDEAGRLWLQRRSRHKDTWGGAWDLSATGHVDPGETYEAAARRELSEELGIAGDPVFVHKFEATARTGWEFQALFAMRHAGPIEDFDPAEVERVACLTRLEIAAAIARPTPDFTMTPAILDALDYLEPWMTAR